MGAWGYNSFENDDAMDWVIDLEASEDFSAIAAALDAVLANVGEFLDARECSNAIAAAEAIAALNGNPAPNLPDEVSQWVNGKSAPDANLVNNAKLAIDTILADSELKELWQESEAYFPQWIATLESLKLRLIGGTQA